MNFAKFRTDVARWGLPKSIYQRVMRHLERLLHFRLFVIHARPLDPDAPQDVLPADCSVRVLDQEEVIEHARNPELGMSREFISDACARGDLCFGYLERGALVAYVWIGLQSTLRRYGNRPIGYAGYLNWFGRAIPFRTPGVRARGFRFARPPPIGGVLH